MTQIKSGALIFGYRIRDPEQYVVEVYLMDAGTSDELPVRGSCSI
jgi:hypothetical protein